MSNEAITWAYGQHTKWGAGCKAVLIALADFADSEHSCYPGQELLAVMTDQNERTVRAQLERLETLGLISRSMRWRKDGRGRTSDRYVLAVDSIPPPSTGLGFRRKRRPAESETGGSERHDQPASDDTINRLQKPGNPQKNPQEDPPVNSEPIAQSAPKAESQPGTTRIVGMDKKFDEFWEIYPRREAKGASKVKLKLALEKGVEFEVILDGARRYRDDPNRVAEFTAFPSTWLHQERWGDDPLPPREAQRKAQTEPTYDSRSGRTPWSE